MTTAVSALEPLSRDWTAWYGSGPEACKSATTLDHHADHQWDYDDYDNSCEIFRECEERVATISRNAPTTMPAMIPPPILLLLGRLY